MQKKCNLIILVIFILLTGNYYAMELVEAIKNNNLSNVKELVEKGEDIDFWGRSGRTPLIYAANKSNTEITKYLLNRGADINKTDIDGNTPLIHALKHYKPNRDLVKLLIESGADINKGSSCWGPLHHAVFYPNQLDILKYLIAQGANVNQQTLYSNDTPLHFASETINIEAIKELLKAGADSTLENDQRYRPHHRAIRKHKDENATLIIGHLIDQAIKNNNLMRAIDLIKKYTKYAIRYTDDKGETLLHIGVANGDENMIKNMLALLYGQRISKINQVKLP